MTDRASADGRWDHAPADLSTHCDGCIAQGRASAEGLREALPILDTMIDRQTLTGAVRVREIVRAALRDTGSRSEPIATLSLYEQGRRQTLMDLGFDIDGIDTATAVEAAPQIWPEDLTMRQNALARHDEHVRDTGPRPDSGIDIVLLEDVAVRYADGTRDGLLSGTTVRLSTPRTETSETADTIRIGSKTYLAGADDD